MNRLEISNLSFCEIRPSKNIDVKGGLSASENFRYKDIPLYLNVLNSVPGQFNSVQVYSGSDIVVNKLLNELAGTSGYKVSSKDGISQAGVVAGGNYNISFASSVHYSNPKSFVKS